MTSQANHRDVRAAALAALASGQQASDGDSVPASQAPVDPADVSLDPGASGVQPPGTEGLNPPARQDDESTCDDAWQVQASAPANLAMNRREQAARHSRLQQRAHACQYKKTMIPVLLVVSAMLWVVGVLSVLLASGVEMFGAGGEQDAGRFAAIGWYSIPLAAILLAGVWLFHRDVKRSN